MRNGENDVVRRDRFARAEQGPGGTAVFNHDPFDTRLQANGRAARRNQSCSRSPYSVSSGTVGICTCQPSRLAKNASTKTFRALATSIRSSVSLSALTSTGFQKRSIAVSDCRCFRNQSGQGLRLATVTSGQPTQTKAMQSRSSADR